VKELLEEGYAVVATCRAPATSTGLQDLLHTGSGVGSGRLLGVVPLDVSDGRSVTAALATVTGELGLTSLDVLINNAGVATAKHPDEPVLEATAEDMQSVFTTNVVGPMLVTQTFYPLLLASSSSSSSSLASALPKVVNVSSRMGSISLYQGEPQEHLLFVSVIYLLFIIVVIYSCRHFARRSDVGFVQGEQGRPQHAHEVFCRGARRRVHPHCHPSWYPSPTPPANRQANAPRALFPPHARLCCWMCRLGADRVGQFPRKEATGDARAGVTLFFTFLEQTVRAHTAAFFHFGKSAKGIVSVLQGLQKDDNGSFFNFDGQQLAW
jgi:NAD(P)-dependent dehydrogenase (short-subunit alcohol dehydrogenase family)